MTEDTGKIYIVRSTNYNTVYAAFSTKQKAEEYRDYRNRLYPDDLYFVFGVQLNPSPGPIHFIYE